MKKILLFLITAMAFLALAGVSFANDVEGTYAYMEEGYTGTMTIRQEGPGFVFTFNTTSDSNGQMCDFETYETPIDQGGGRDVDDLPAHGGTVDDGIRFSISFEGDTAFVDVESHGMECGMSGNFNGPYVKAE